MKEKTIKTTRSSSARQTSLTELRLVFRRIVSMLGTLLVIAYLTSLGLILAERGREHLPAQPLNAVLEALVRLGQYLFAHPQTYYWHKANLPAFGLVSEILGNSAVLLLFSLGLAVLIGVPLGIAAALSKHKSTASVMMLVSVLGVSTPSFLLGMLFWVVNIQIYRWFNVSLLPSVGFGLDAHLIMPALVLAMRPLAQIAQVTYVTVTDVLRQDYIRTAKAKGVPEFLIRYRHAMRNVLIPVLTTLGTSLRFSLASLPVVELFFAWPGVGLTLLEAISRGNAPLVIDLILSLGMFFLLVNLLIEVSFPLLDARLRENGGTQDREERQTIFGWLRGVGEMLGSWARGVLSRFRTKSTTLPPLPKTPDKIRELNDHEQGSSRRRWVLHSLGTNPTLIIGTLLVLALAGLVFFGERLTSTSPYETHTIMIINGKVYAPPFEPSSVFPWGTDYVGRDIQALVLYGARQTLSLAFFGMLARVLLGVFFGGLAGWQRGGWLDRLITGAIGVWAAFPVTLFAMIVIQALGIQQGMVIFVIGISVVGWGEVAQFVRGQVIGLKPQLYVESARSIGARDDQIMLRHIFPNLVGSLIVVAVLEMGGVLMLLAELGYLDVFLGGGFAAMIGEGPGMTPIILHFSDVPEWAALIANVRSWWRSYPWMAFYPGIAFFLSIMAFNLLGEGLRRFLDESQANLSRIFNRYTFMGGVSILVALSLVLRSNTPLGVYHAEGLKFDQHRVMQDIQALASPAFQGRETGTPGAEKAADYIAKRMSEIGLLPAGQNNTFLQNLVDPRYHLAGLPELSILNGNGQPVGGLVYRQDYAEIGQALLFGDARAPVMGLVFGPPPESTSSDPYGLRNSPADGRVVIVHAADLGKVNVNFVAGILVIADDQYSLERRDVYPYQPFYYGSSVTKPAILISSSLADRLLASAGSSLAQLDQIAGNLGVGKYALTGEGESVRMSIPVYEKDDLSENYINVLGFIPGEAAEVGSGLDQQVIIVSAYYDGLGVGPDGTLYPGANDNASGVAMMLELARLLKESPYKPDKTVLFVAWAGGERREGLSVVNIMNAKTGFNLLTVEAVIELSGVGSGSGNSIALGEDSSYRLVKLYQSAASRYNVATTTRGRSPHYGHEARPGFGQRSALTLSVSWDGSDQDVHTPRDAPEIIDPNKLREIGRSTYLTLLVLARETEY
jgi:ABC-type dipeptide/oligopeptide/nickel transport system permease component